MTNARVRAGAIAVYAATRGEHMLSAKPHFEELPDINKTYFDDLARKVLEAADATWTETPEKLSVRPVAFRVKNHADGWILFTDEEAAYNEAGKTGAVMQGLYHRAGDSE